MLGNWMRSRARKKYKKEFEHHLNHLRSLDNRSMGLVLAIAAHQRNALIKDGVDMRDLSKIVHGAPMYHLDLAKAVNVLVKNKRQHDALGLQVWMHSFRALLDEELYPYGVAIWEELERGRPHVARARESVKDETDFELDVAMAGETPPEFLSRREQKRRGV